MSKSLYGYDLISYNGNDYALPVMKAGYRSECPLSGERMNEGDLLVQVLKSSPKRGGRNCSIWVRQDSFYDSAREILGRKGKAACPPITSWDDNVVFFLASKTDVTYALFGSEHEDLNGKTGYDGKAMSPSVPEPKKDDEPAYEGGKAAPKKKEPKADTKDEDLLNVLKRLLGNGEIEKIAEMRIEMDEIKKLIESGGMNNEAIEDLRKEVEQLAKRRVLTLNLPDTAGGDPTPVKGLVHPELENCIKIVLACNQHLLLYGPAGTGKSYMAKQIAAACKLPFYMISCNLETSVYDLYGRRTVVAEGGVEAFVPGAFTKAFTGWSDKRVKAKPGLLCMDEYDACYSNTVISMNGPLSGGRGVDNTLSLDRCFSKPVVEQHKDFAFVACANTTGKGGDYNYQREVQDTASTDRLVPVSIDFDHELETSLVEVELSADKSGSCDMSLAEALWKVRANLAENKLQEVVGMRRLCQGYRLWVQGGFSPEEYLTKTLPAGWSEDTKEKAFDGVLSSSGKLII